VNFEFPTSTGVSEKLPQLFPARAEVPFGSKAKSLREKEKSRASRYAEL
jgi:hypothetical protein